jgi:phosphatidate cytidylyltransferase
MTDFVDQIAQRAGLKANVVWVLAVIALALAGGSVVRLAGLFLRPPPPEESRARTRSLATWWALFALLVLVALVGRAAAVVIFAGASLLGLREFRALAGDRVGPVRPWWLLAYLAVPVHYLLVYLRWLEAFWTFIPVGMFVLLLARLALSGRTSGYLETAGITFLGLVQIVFLFSHAALLLALPDEVNPVGGAFGLFLFLVVLTEANDIAQALWGRRFGRRKILPTVSPSKTWEGFLLGGATTVALAFALARPLTPFADSPMRVGQLLWNVHPLPALAAGGFLAVGGFLGDATLAAVKRQAGVKDSGTLLPGQGGVLDRINSLTFTGPLFFYFVYTFYRPGGEP